MEKQIALLLVLLLCSSVFAFAVPGTANSFPASEILSPCKGSFHSIYEAKASDAFWANGAVCGKPFCVVCNGAIDPSKPSPCRGPRGYIVVIIGAYCPNCSATISISENAFAAIADPNITNNIKIDYAQTQNANLPCA